MPSLGPRPHGRWRGPVHWRLVHGRFLRKAVGRIDYDAKCFTQAMAFSQSHDVYIFASKVKRSNRDRSRAGEPVKVLLRDILFTGMEFPDDIQVLRRCVTRVASFGHSWYASSERLDSILDVASL